MPRMNHYRNRVAIVCVLLLTTSVSLVKSSTPQHDFGNSTLFPNGWWLGEFVQTTCYWNTFTLSRHSQKKNNKQSLWYEFLASRLMISPKCVTDWSTNELWISLIGRCRWWQGIDGTVPPMFRNRFAPLMCTISSMLSLQRMCLRPTHPTWKGGKLVWLSEYGRDTAQRQQRVAKETLSMFPPVNWVNTTHL